MTLAPKQNQKAITARKIAFIAVLGLICLAIALVVVHRSAWIIPPGERTRKNPLTMSEENLRSAKKIYSEQCDNCHGESGKGDGSDAMMYDPAPADLTDAANINKRTDGELFYQISEGRKPMPSFKKKLSEQQRWQLVLLVRAFAARQSGAWPTAPSK